MRNNSYPLTRLSEKARELLPSVLDEAGYQGRYQINSDRNTLSINSNWGKVGQFFHAAEAKAKGEEGRFVILRRESFSTLWIDGDKPLKEAYEEAIAAAKNGWPVDRDTEYSVSSAEESYDSRSFRQEWELEYMKA